MLWVAVVFLAAVFLLGGGARADIQSLVVLRPLAAGCLLFALTMPSVAASHEEQFLRRFAFACIGLAAIHLVPLPPALWQALPGRELVVQIDAAAGLSGTWRPLAMVPADGYNALFSLVVPSAALALALRLRASGHETIVVVLIGIGLASIILGILQLLGGDASPFYTYRIQNRGSLDGLFSNRNHHAIFLACLLPLLAELASRPVETQGKLSARLAGLVLIAIFVGIAIVVTASRAGVVVGLAGALAAVALYRHPVVGRRTHRHTPAKTAPDLRKWRYGIAAALLALAVAFFALGQSAVGERMANSGADNELRVQYWGPVADAIASYFPFGSGNGSFVEVFQIREPLSLLGNTYVNHAHNDWLEVAMTLGLPGIVLAGIAMVAWIRGTRRVMATTAVDGTIRLARVGAAIIAMLALGSLADYPLRTPSIACLFVFAAVWLSRGYARTFDRAGDFQT